jgi:hypothetical protein
MAAIGAFVNLVSSRPTTWRSLERRHPRWALSSLDCQSSATGLINAFPNALPPDAPPFFGPPASAVINLVKFITVAVEDGGMDKPSFGW